MTDPMERFRLVFFEECTELLQQLEEGLVALQSQSDDEETINAVFRAVHSIKGGGAGSFGFKRLVEFSHVFESLLGAIRSGNIIIETAHFDVLLRAADILSELVEAAQSDCAVADDHGGTVVTEMSKIIGSGALRSGEKTSLFSKKIQEDALHRYQISFRPLAELFVRANEPLLLIRELKTLGELKVTVHTSAVPFLEELEPDMAYFFWDFSLVTSEALDVIEEVFEFVEDDCELKIEDLGLYLAAEDFKDDDDAGLFQEVDEFKEESPAEDIKPQPAVKNVISQSIRVNLDKVDRLVNMVGELVITQAMLKEQVGLLNPDQFSGLIGGIEELSRHTRDMQSSVMAIRSQPVKTVFARLPRLVREISASLDKKVNLVITGQDTEVDKTVTEQLGDPLIHMIRNALDHGLESPRERRAAGKPEEGTITLTATHRGERIFIEMEDDGRGINRKVVLEKAREKGLVPPEANFSDDEIDNLIFLPGFSTAENVSDLSGRGVGMDVVRRNIQNLGGRVRVTSTPGKSTKFTLSLPLTLAVMDGMIFRMETECYVLPLASIIQSIQPETDDINELPDGSLVMMFREEYIPLVCLRKIFSLSGPLPDPCEGLIVVVEGNGGSLMGLMVDELIGQQQVVIKSLESNYQSIDGISGVTILGNGMVALIIDIAGIQEITNYRSWDEDGRGKMNEQREVH